MQNEHLDFFSLLYILKDSEFSIENDNTNNSVSINIKIYLNKKENKIIHFKVILLEKENYVEYIPIKLDFPIKENDMLDFSKELEIYKEDILLLINTFLEIKEKYEEKENENI